MYTHPAYNGIHTVYYLDLEAHNPINSYLTMVRV